MAPDRIEAIRVVFGDYTSLSRGRAGGFAYTIEGEHFWLEDPPRPATYSELATYGEFPPEPPGPFERADFGAHVRLSWPEGACAIPNGTRCVFWERRFVTWSEADTLCFADATRPEIVRWTLPDQEAWWSHEPIVHDGRIAFYKARAYVLLRLADVVALFDRPSGPLPVVAHTRYPYARDGHEQQVRVVGLEGRDGRMSVLLPRSYPVTLTLPRIPGAAMDMMVTLRHRITGETWREVELPDGTTHATGVVREPEVRELATTLVVAPGEDPAGRHRAGEIAVARVDELDRLFSDRADAPDDEATRLVLIDALEQELVSTAHRTPRCSRRWPRARRTRTCGARRSGRSRAS